MGLLVMFAGLVVQCASFNAIGAVVEPNPATTGTSRSADEARYRIHVGDMIEMSIYQEDELTTKVRVDQDGSVLLPLIGNVDVAGKTVNACAELIRKAFMKDYLVNPIVNLTVVEFGKAHFTVLGQVKRPGYYLYPANRGLNLLQAIAMAGGYTRIGSPSKITVNRTSGGSEQVIRVNAKEMAKEANRQLFEVKSGDTISVGESLF